MLPISNVADCRASSKAKSPPPKRNTTQDKHRAGQTPPRRRPGPNWESRGNEAMRHASIVPQLGPGLRRGGGILRASHLPRCFPAKAGTQSGLPPSRENRKCSSRAVNGHRDRSIFTLSSSGAYLGAASRSPPRNRAASMSPSSPPARISASDNAPSRFANRRPAASTTSG